MLDDLRVLIQAIEHLLGGVDLELADGGLRVDDLALQVGLVDDVEVDETDGPDAGGGEIEGERCSEAAGSNAENLCGFELLLAFHADLREDEVARVARDLLIREFGEIGFGEFWNQCVCRHDLSFLPC